MRNKKTNIKPTRLLPTFPGPASLIPSRLLSHPWAVQEGHGTGGLWSIHNISSLASFLLTHITCSSVGSPHRLQSFRRKICAIADSLQATVPPGHIHLLWYESSMGCRGYWLWHAPRHWLQGSICSGVWNTSTSDLGVLSTVSYSFCCLLFCLCGIVCSSLTMFFPRCHPFGWAAQLCPAVGLLEPDRTACVWHREAPASSHQGHPCSPATTNTLTWTPSTVLFN